MVDNKDTIAKILNLDFFHTPDFRRKGEKAIAATNMRRNRRNIGETSTTIARAIITNREKKSTVPESAINALILIFIYIYEFRA
jgi:hypothetical protein